MNFQLTSAFSTRVSWEPIDGVKVYSVQWRQGNVVKETKSAEPEIVLLNLEPDTSYDVRVSCVGSSQNSQEGTFSTFPEDQPHLENLYESVKLEDGTYDATKFEKKAHDVFLKYFNEVVKNGDVIYASVVYNGETKNIETQAVLEGSTVSVSGDKNLFLPFTPDSSNKNQVVTLENNVKNNVDDENTYAHKVKLNYTPKEDSFILGDRVLKVGDKFELFGRSVTVADGSIVLVFEDTVQFVFPFDTSVASNVTTTAGSQFSKNVTCNVTNIIGTTTTGVAGSAHQSSWIYDSTADTISESTRIVHTIDDAGEVGGMSIGTLYTDGAGNKFLEPSLQMNPTSTTISVQDANDSTVNTTVNSNGISFSQDSSAIFFGSNQTFRIIFVDGAEPVLAIQSFDSASGEYVSRAEFGTGI